jgi:hypothetical protein
MSHTFEIKRYTPEFKSRWDQFVRESKNGTFLFYRDYMDYHADRFADCSLLFYKNGNLVALLPANEKGKTLYSHGGLSYGGLLMTQKTRTGTALALFDHLRLFLRQSGFERLVYKAIPYLYHQVPAQEDLYALFRLGAALFRRDVSSAIDLGQPIVYSRNRTNNLKKAEQVGIAIARSADFAEFMELQESVLRKKYGTNPTHTAAEIASLAQKFPENIVLYLARDARKIVAGTVLYVSGQVVHAQYIAGSETGKDTGALELLLDHVIRKYSGSKRYFDFGISTEKQGTYLNLSLMDSKERYGARAVTFDFYELLL